MTCWCYLHTPKSEWLNSTYTQGYQVFSIPLHCCRMRTYRHRSLWEPTERHHWKRLLGSVVCSHRPTTFPATRWQCDVAVAAVVRRPLTASRVCTGADAQRRQVDRVNRAVATGSSDWHLSMRLRWSSSLWWELESEDDQTVLAALLTTVEVLKLWGRESGRIGVKNFHWHIETTISRHMRI